MASLTADFELGTNGNTIATGDTGSATAWNSVAGAPKYDTARAHEGTKSAKFSTSAADLFWSSTTTDQYGRAYLFIPTGAAGADLTLVHAARQTGVAKAQIIVKSTGKLQIADSGLAHSLISTNSFAVDQWIRVEWHVTISATVGTFEVKLFNTVDATVETEKLTSTANWNTGSSIDTVGFGTLGGGAPVSAINMDNLVAQASAYPGSFPVNSVAPAVTGSTAVGSTLTCDGGTWNGTFTLAYQWTNAGSNIGGATSSTYVTVDADIGAAIGCKVTATGQQATNENATQASGNTITPTAINPANSVAPVASGSTTVGSVLSVTNGTWTGDPIPTFTYQWQRDVAGNLSYSNISSATASSYTLVTADNACHVRCVVTGTNSGGNASANSNAILDTSGSGGGGSTGRPDPSKTASAVVILGL